MAEVQKSYPYSLGCLLWAKIGKHPFWPCMVSYDPNNGSFFKRVKAKNVETEIYHVQYFGKSLQHGWTTTLVFPFEGQDKFFAKRDVGSTSNEKKLRNKYYIPPSVMTEWQFAVKEAEKALSYRIEDRYELFVFKYDFNFKKMEKVKRKRKKKMSQRKKKPQKLVSQTSSIVEPLCFYCEKGNVDLFCCSGVCTQSFHKECVGIIQAPSNFLCANCIVDKKQPCIICKCVGGGTTKCSKCDNYYHDYCLELFKCADIKKNVCSAHVCWRCYVKNPRNGSSKGSFVTCFRCPTAFHDTVNCLPAGCVKLSPSVIICPQHFLGKNKISSEPVSNVSVCSACFDGGELICCESCPYAYHEACIDGEVPLGDFFCEDCSAKKYLYCGMMIWAKHGIYRWWPAVVKDPDEVPLNIKALQKYDGEFPVQFFGSDDFSWTHRGRVFPYNDLNRNMRVSCSKTNKELWIKFKIGLEEASLAYDQLKQKFLTSDSRPPHFRHIRVNRAIPPAVIYNVRQSACSCSPLNDNPCGPDSSCINRQLLFECHPDVCKAGEKCQNQIFQRRGYASVKVMKTANRGWGLRAQQFIPEGSFVIEYVGEIITHKEYERRTAQMRIQNSQNYYFLYLDKDRMIDAGPSGNLSRFINHSCTPNCVMEKWGVNGDLRIGIFALTDIERGAEITFNYQFESVEFGQKCFCDQPNCLGVIGRNKKKKRKLQ